MCMAPLAKNIVSEVSNHVLFIKSDQNSESLGLENKLDHFWDLESIDVLDNGKHSQEHFVKFSYFSKKNRYEAKLPFRENHALYMTILTYVENV